MGTKVDLGGSRIGSGKKMEVELHAFSSSSHNVTQITRTSQAVGTIVPIYKRLLLKDNKLELDLNAMVHTNPTEGPCFGEFELQIHVYSAPLRLFQGKLHMNMLDEGTEMENIKFPLIEYKADDIDFTKNPDNQQINPSSVFAYLGDRGLGSKSVVNDGGEIKRYRNAIPWLMLHDINANYYVNQQEKVGYIIHNLTHPRTVEACVKDPEGVNQVIGYSPAMPTESVNMSGEKFVFITGGGNHTVDTEIAMWVNGEVMAITEIWGNIVYNPVAYGASYICTNQLIPLNSKCGGWFYTTAEMGTQPELFEFPLTNYNDMRMDILSHVKSNEPYIINSESIAPFGPSLGKEGDVWSKTISQEGLPLRTYKSDWFNNWLSTEAIDAINLRTRVMTDNQGGFTMNQFLLQEKMFRYLNRVTLAGNTVDDWELAAYGTKSNRPTEKSVFEGALHKRISFDEVVNQSADGKKPLGTLAATGKMDQNYHKGGKVSIKVDEASYVMVVASIVPLPDYNQGNDWDGDLLSMEDLHNPNKDKIGFQNLITDWMCSWDTKFDGDGNMVQYSAGKQPSWLHYQTNVNKTFGTFAELSEEWMVLARKFEADPITGKIKDLTSYIDPAKWNFPFANESRSAQNFRMQYLIKAEQRILMSANQIPGL